ncbi:tRNA (adenosine(37)-N6)-dimethylallyltransferase MiaA [Candidatus Parcubacteria bacterium]|nr:tRNA (adenosine(37)-N6)-dimethylallyltransferase MiaA [Candidatus Parcubacteria bacterium]
MIDFEKNQVLTGKLIVILGPTASGKSAWAIEFAKEFAGEIINADSRQMYRDMNIETNTPTPEEMAGIPHHLFEIKNPDEDFAVKEYKNLAIQTIREIQERGNIPFLVGGTGLYIQAVVENLEIPQVPPQKALREKLEKTSLEKLLQMLRRLDPEAAQRIDRKNKRRMIRAIEVTLGGATMVEPKKGPRLFETLQIGIAVPREELYRRIEERVDEMIKAGLIEEAEKLMAQYPRDLPALSGIGYQEIIPYLQDRVSLEEAMREIIKSTKAFARRQMTWFRRDKTIRWVKTRGLIKTFLRSEGTPAA